MKFKVGTRYLVVCDIETTCCNSGTIKRHEMEIIEIGAVIVDTLDFSVVSEFQSFVKPQIHPELTSFCSHLTSIKQEDVDPAPTFPVAIQEFSEWMDKYPDSTFSSWGNFDWRIISDNCTHHEISNPLERMPKENLSKRFIKAFDREKKASLKKALNIANLGFEGNHHRGIDDARNAARLTPFIYSPYESNKLKPQKRRRQNAPEI